MKTKRVKVEHLKPGPIRHTELSPLLIARIASVQSALKEVYPQSLDKWLDGFQRDAHPESEVQWWENLVACYTKYTGEKELDSSQAQAAFGLMVGLAMGAWEADLQSQAANLPPGALEEIVGLIRGSRIQ